MSGNSHEHTFLLLLVASTAAHGWILWTGQRGPEPTLYARAGEVGVEVRLAARSPASAATSMPDPLADGERSPELERSRRAAARPLPRSVVASAPQVPRSPTTPLPVPPPISSLEPRQEVLLIASVAAIASDGAAPKPIGVRSPPRLVGEHTPLYPAEARRRRVEGRVLLRLSIKPDGRVEEAKVETSSGSPLLDAAALDFGRAARFEPAFDGIEAIHSQVLLPVSFRLVAGQ